MTDNTPALPATKAVAERIKNAILAIPPDEYNLLTAGELAQRLAEAAQARDGELLAALIDARDIIDSLAPGDAQFYERRRAIDATIARNLIDRGVTE